MIDVASAAQRIYEMSVVQAAFWMAVIFGGLYVAVRFGYVLLERAVLWLSIMMLGKIKRNHRYFLREGQMFKVRRVTLAGVTFEPFKDAEGAAFIKQKFVPLDTAARMELTMVFTDDQAVQALIDRPRRGRVSGQ